MNHTISFKEQNIAKKQHKMPIFSWDEREAKNCKTSKGMWLQLSKPTKQLTEKVKHQYSISYCCEILWVPK